MSGLQPAGDGEMYINGKKLGDVSSFEFSGALDGDGVYPEPVYSFPKHFSCECTGMLLPPCTGKSLEAAAERMMLGAGGSHDRVTAEVREMGEARLRRILDEHFGAT